MPLKKLMHVHKFSEAAVLVFNYTAVLLTFC